MSFTKIKNMSYKIMLYALLILLLYVTYCSIFNIYDSFAALQPIVIIIGVIISLFLFIRLKKIFGKIKESKSDLIAIVLCILFLIGLAVFGKLMTSIPTFDLSSIQQCVEILLENGRDMSNMQYLARFQNQIPLTILIYFIYAIGDFFGFDNLRYFAAVVNALFIAVTAFFVYLSVKKLSNHQYGLLALLFFIINPVFYTYVSFFYTDCFCMPFAAIAVYLFILAMQEQNNKKTILKLIIAGIMLSFGFKIRVVVGILLIGMIISLFLKNKLTKKFVIDIGSILMGFIIGLLIYMAISRLFILPKNNDLQFPMTHFIMMGLNEEYGGGYNKEDWDYTYSWDSYEKKNQEDMKVIKERANELGIKGMISLIKEKLAKVWSNGDYEYVNKLTNVENVNKLYEYVVGNKKIFILYFHQICKALILILFMIALIKEIRNKDIIDKNYSIIYISIFGAFLFYFIWEANRRYSLSFLPWMIIVMGVGLSYIEKILNIKKIQLNYRNNRMTVVNIEKIKRITSIATLSLTVFLLGINYFEYAVDENLYWDTRVVQYSQTGNLIEKISNNRIEQTFKTNKSFSCISIMMKKGNITSTTHYEFVLKDGNGKTLSKQEFTSDQVSDNTYRTFHFDKIYPDGLSEFVIEISSKDATEENSIGIATYYSVGRYDPYEGGVIRINGEKKEGDFTFYVYNKTTRSYTSKRVYLVMSLCIILIEIYAVYPYLRNKNEEYEEYV